MIVDLSHPLKHGQQTFPMDPKLSIVQHCSTKTLKYNLSHISINSHQGTHLDAMYHFIDDGKTLDQMPLDWFYGPARVLRIPKQAREEITREDFQKYEQYLMPDAKILIDTGWHKMFGKENFFEDFPSITQDAARYLASRKIRMIGMDMPTPSRDYYEVHHILLAHDVEMVIVEALANLSQLPDTFTFIGFPLNFTGLDGSPIRAVAVTGD